ncbi:MAG: acetylglucosamine-6-sulfatase, partial [Tannerella sp.]|nr:acetylglucosamine-6-sulfatase [Tannerella sp.]
MNPNIFNPLFISAGVAGCLTACTDNGKQAQTQPSSAKPLNVVFILSDDHRYDYMGFMNRIPWLE